MSIAHKVNQRTSNHIELTITVPKEIVNDRFEQVYNDYAAQVQIKGFRPGHVPRGMVLEQIGGRILEETLDRLLSQGYRDSLLTEKVVPVGQPTITLKKWTATADGHIQDDLEFSCTTELIPPVELGDYSNIQLPESISEQPLDITDQDVESVLSHLRRQKATQKNVAKEHKIENGDLAIISYEGLVDGVKVGELANKHYPVVIGAGALVGQFENQLIGATVGERRTFTIPLPSSIQDKELAGQSATFEVVIDEVKELELPDLNDAFAGQLGVKDLMTLRRQIEENLKQERAQAKQRKIEGAVIDQALQLLKVELPNALIDEEVERMMKRLGDESRRRGLPLPIYLEKMKKTEAQARQEFRPPAQDNIRLGLMLGEVIKRERLDIKDVNAPRLAVERLVEIAKANSFGKVESKEEKGERKL